MDLAFLVGAAGRPPEPWSEGRTIPWDDPAFSRRMLREHLSQAHDAASRRTELIDRHVEFIAGAALPPRPSRVLDLGCGPGFYAHRLAQQGHDASGIDFAPAAIEYVREEARRVGLVCRFDCADIRETDLGDGYDLIMLLYGEINLFPRDEAKMLLARCGAALAPEGRVLLEVHDYDAVRARGEAAPRWSAVQSGVFSDRPHLRLDESFWLEEEKAAVGRHWVVDGRTGAVERYGWTMLAYTEKAYVDLLAEAGLRLEKRSESLLGQADGTGFPVLVAVRV